MSGEVLVEVAALIAERDRAREIAVRLEQELAEAVRILRGWDETDPRVIEERNNHARSLRGQTVAFLASISTEDDG